MNIHINKWNTHIFTFIYHRILLIILIIYLYIFLDINIYLVDITHKILKIQNNANYLVMLYFFIYILVV